MKSLTHKQPYEVSSKDHVCELRETFLNFDVYISYLSLLLLTSKYGNMVMFKSAVYQSHVQHL